MHWYYAQKNRQMGPINDEAFSRLIETGAIRSETLVWRQGMNQWATLGQVRAGAEDDGERTWGFCSECGNTFTNENLIHFQDVRICHLCKGRYFQQIIEGARTYSSIEYGGFWLRFAAKMIDGIIVGIGQMLLTLPLTLIFHFGATEMAVWISIFNTILQIVIDAGYRIFFVGKYGATLGKMACSLKIVTSDGKRVGYARATGRYFAEYLSVLTMGIGYFIAAFDDQKRTLHDHLCDTRVVKK